MGKRRRTLRDFLPTQRRLVQLYAALLYNAHVKGFISGEIYTGKIKFACVPGLNCYSCPGAVGACPLGALQNALASAHSRAPFYILGILMLYGLLLGRSICGWLCPVGLLQELLHKLPTPKIGKSRVTRVLSRLKYLILAVLVAAVPLYFSLRRFPLPAFCKFICPAGTLEGAVALLLHPSNADKLGMLGGVFTRKFLILLAIAALCIFAYRGFCRFLCPLGAIYGLFNRFALVGVKVETQKCVDCGACAARCPMDVRRVGDSECISCGKCISACPTAAIRLKAGNAVLMEKSPPPEKARRRTRIRRAVWAAALVLLAAALLCFNLPKGTEPLPDSAPAQSAAPAEPVTPEQGSEGEASVPPAAEVGSEVGMRAPDFTLPLYGGGSVGLADFSGRTLVLNFWATWCSPCVAELPHFDELYRSMGDSVGVLAVHSELVTDDVEAFLASFDFDMPFALDESGGMIASYGGSTMLPQTVVVGSDGIIRYNAVGALSQDALLELVTAPRAEEAAKEERK